MNKSTYACIFTGITLIIGLISFSCDNKQAMESKANKADSTIFDIGLLKDYERMRALADSFEMSGDITPLNANRWRGASYYREGNNTMAEICFRKALECKITSEQDLVSYIKSARRLSEILLVKSDYEGSLSIAIPAVEKMDNAGIGSDIDYAILLNTIGCCQLNLGHDEEAKESFITARERYVSRWESDSTSRGFQEAVVGTVYTSMAYINTRRYYDAIYWIDRSAMLLNEYRKRPDARKEYFDEYQGRIEIMRAVAREGLGDEEIERKMEKIKRRQERKRTLPPPSLGREQSPSNISRQPNSSTHITPSLPGNAGGESGLEPVFVRLKGQTSVGRLLSIDGKNATVLFGQMWTTVKVDRLVPAQEPQKQASPMGATFVSRDTHNLMREKSLHF